MLEELIKSHKKYQAEKDATKTIEEDEQETMMVNEVEAEVYVKLLSLGEKEC